MRQAPKSPSFCNNQVNEHPKKHSGYQLPGLLARLFPDQILHSTGHPLRRWWSRPGGCSQHQQRLRTARWVLDGSAMLCLHWSSTLQHVATTRLHSSPLLCAVHDTLKNIAFHYMYRTFQATFAFPAQLFLPDSAMHAFQYIAVHLIKTMFTLHYMIFYTCTHTRWNTHLHTLHCITLHCEYVITLNYMLFTITNITPH